MLQRIGCWEYANRDVGSKSDSGRQVEDTVDELIRDPHITLSQPSYLPFPNLVDRLVTLDSSLCAIEMTEMLLGTNPLLDGPVVLLQDVIQVRDRPMPTAPPEDALVLSLRDGQRTTPGFIRIAVLITRGCGWERSDSDLLNNALAASAERTAERKKSIVAPLESRARYK